MTSEESNRQSGTSPSQQLQEAEQQQEDPNRSKRNPFCSRCRNHGKSAQVKGHKRHCEYRNCQCEGCKLVEFRQMVSAEQIKRRRYQKQDEECGRRIEISPPVLKHERANDTVALIAKTLIGSAVIKQQQHQKSLTSTTHNQLSSLHQPHLSGIVAAANETSATNAHHLNHLTQHHTNGTTNGGSNHNNSNNYHQLGFNQHHQSQQQQQHHNHHHQQQAALNNAFHLFHFPNSMLSAAAAASLGSQQPQAQPHPFHHSPHLSHPASIQPTSTNNNHSSSNNQLPSIREQISLVDEIHQFGPLAIYAWLKAEKFDLQKVRDLIEASRTHYNNLLDLKSKYRLSSSGSGGNNNYDLSSSINIGGGGKSLSETSEELSSSNKQRDSSSSPANINESTMVAKSSSSTALNTSFPTLMSPTVPINELSSSQLYTQLGGHGYIGKTSSNTVGGTKNNSSEGAQTITTSTSISSNNNQHNMSSIVSSLPITTTSGLFWPSLKLTTSGAAAAAAMHPHHLLPHFVHHPFMSHPLHHHQQQHQHHQQQISPTVTNSSSSASSSSVL